jgi:probable F420-dependent oxidoreductase
MQIGFNLPNSGPLSKAADMMRLAVDGEAMGFDYLTVTDHVVLPDTKVPGYPYSESGAFYEEAPLERHEQLVGMAYIAAKTSRIRLVAAVLVVPHRPAVLAAKMLATLDVLSGGRLIMGVGVGLIEKEIRAMGSPYAERGAFTDEAIAVMRALWTQDEPKFEGKFSRFDGMKFSPKPLQKPSIPVVIGGVSRHAIRRAARLGDGWQPLGLAPETLGQGMADLREAARAAGRDAATIPVSIAMSLAAARAGRHALGTKPAEIIKNAKAYAGHGVDTLIVSANTSEPREAMSALEMIARDVVPALAGP